MFLAAEHFYNVVDQTYFNFVVLCNCSLKSRNCNKIVSPGKNKKILRSKTICIFTAELFIVSIILQLISVYRNDIEKLFCLRTKFFYEVTSLQLL